MLIQDYLNLITSEYAEQPNFLAVIAANVATPVQVQQLLASMIPLFDLSTPPVGNQLDIIGQWAGVSRDVNIPASSGILFTWDGPASEGWDRGTWSTIPVPTTITVLPDDAYLLLIKAKIAANNWDGTIDGAYVIWDALFQGTVQIFIFDYQNMTYAMGFAGGVISSLTLALITGGYIPLRPEGVEITAYYIAVPGEPIFSWDSNSPLLQGWDTGYWATELFPT